MIYFDSAATSLQKPPTVAQASFRAIQTLSSPGRGAYKPAMDAADCVYDCRTEIAELFNVDDPTKVVFTENATHGLNIAISSLVTAGDRVVVSGFEHNAVIRPLHALKADIVIARTPLFDKNAVIESFTRLLPGASCAVCTQVSNVFGFVLPIKEIAQLCKIHDVPLIIDASQAAGVLPLDFSELGATFAAMPGHKGLLGPQGTGVLLCGIPGDPIIFGGTGSDSKPRDMPDFLPDRHEAGTHNVAGIAGLLSGVKYIKSRLPNAVLKHERDLLMRFCNGLSRVDRIRLYKARDLSLQTGVVSMTVEGVDCETLAHLLGRQGICVRAGLHCAPCAHETAGTLDTGTVRFSFSPFNTAQEIDRGVYVLKNILKSV